MLFQKPKLRGNLQDNYRNEEQSGYFIDDEPSAKGAYDRNDHEGRILEVGWEEECCQGDQEKDGQVPDHEPEIQLEPLEVYGRVGVLKDLARVRLLF